MPVLVVLLAGCATIPAGVKDPGPGATAVELVATPFYPQQRYQCGPAALTTVLAASGANVSLGELVDKVYLPARKGSLQVEMLAATRTSGRIPYRLQGTVSALLDELRAGRPVLVLQNLGIRAWPRWHYAVVVGLDPQQGEVVLRSGTVERRVTPLGTFLRTWQRSDYWAFVALRPEQLPVSPDRPRYLAAIASVENAGELAAAATAWQTALSRWPGDPVALFGAANTAMKTGDYELATRRYRELLRRDGSLAAVRNNLALALARRGDVEAALAEVERAIEEVEDDGLRAEFEATRQEILGLEAAG